MTYLKSLFLVLCGLIALVGLTRPAWAVLEVDITQGNVNPLPIAIPDFHAGQNAPAGQVDVAKVGADMAGVINANLERSGLFRPISRQAFLAPMAPAIALQPQFADWRAVGASALVLGQIDIESDGRMLVQFRLWDVFGQQQLIGRRYRTTPENWRRVSHMISDEVYKRLTGEEGYFNSRIVYVAETGSKAKPVKRLAIMDQDGYDNKFLTDGRNLVLTPRFSPSQQEITYLGYDNNKPQVYLLNIDTGRRELLGNFPGMTFAPRFSPDGNKVIMSMAQGGNSDIYVMDLRTRALTRLTDNPAIDTSPSFSPDEMQVVFNSDRGGSQQLYVMDRSGQNVKRISFGSGRYATPVWSPRGDLIAFTKIEGGQFHIGVMRPDGSGERILTTSFLDEGPTWSPNGRVLMFFRQKPFTSSGAGGGSELWSVDLTGYNERRVVTPTDGSDPAWSPLIQ
jgi:TolB protein